MSSNAYIIPNVLPARGVAFTAFNSGISLALGSYEPGLIYVYDGTLRGLLSLTPTTLTSTSLFGSWVHDVLNGQVPTVQNTGGIQFVSNSTGSINWIQNAFSGLFGLQVQVMNGGILPFNRSLPGLIYSVVGSETFTTFVKFLDVVPDQIELQFYELNTGWSHRVFWGSDKFLLTPSTNKGAIPPPSINQWVALSYTAADLNLNSGNTITGISWCVWKTNGSVSVVFSDTNSSVGLSTSGTSSAATTVSGGFIDATSDGSTGFYILQHTKNLVHINDVSGGTTNLINLLGLNRTSFTGMTSIGPTPYFIANDGTIFSFSNSTGLIQNLTSAPPFPPNSSTSFPSRWLQTSNNKLYSMFLSSKDIGIYDIPSNTWISSGLSSIFSSSLDTFALSNYLMAGGSNYITIRPTLSSVSGMIYAKTPNQILLTSIPDNLIDVWNFTSGGWSHGPQIIGAGSPGSIAVTPDGNQALVANTSANILQLLKAGTGTWTSTPISLSAPSSIAITPSGTQALVSQTGGNTVSVMGQSAGSWVVQQTLPVPGATGITITPDGLSAAIISSSGLTLLSNNTGVWSVNTSIALNPIPTLVASDVVNSANKQIYAVAPATTSTVYVVTGSSLISQYTLAGLLGSILVDNFQVITPTVSNSGIVNGNVFISSYVGGQITSGMVSGIGPPMVSSAKASSVFVSNPIDFPNLMLVSSSNPVGIWELTNDKQYSIVRSSNSVIAVDIQNAWLQVDLNNRNRVTSIISTGDGTILATLVDDEIYVIQNNAVASSFPFLLIPPINQQSGIPLGANRSLIFNQDLFTTSSLTGGLFDVSLGIPSNVTVTSGVSIPRTVVSSIFNLASGVTSVAQTDPLNSTNITRLGSNTIIAETPSWVTNSWVTNPGGAFVLNFSVGSSPGVLGWYVTNSGATPLVQAGNTSVLYIASQAVGLSVPIALPSWQTNVWVGSISGTNITFSFSTAPTSTLPLNVVLFSGDHTKITTITTGTTSLTVATPVTLNTPTYAIFAIPNWNTTITVTNKTLDNFTFNFSAAPANAVIYWVLVSGI